MKGLRHQYADDDECVENDHEFGIYPGHGLSGSQIAAIKAKSGGSFGKKGATAKSATRVKPVKALPRVGQKARLDKIMSTSPKAKTASPVAKTAVPHAPVVPKQKKMTSGPKDKKKAHHPKGGHSGGGVLRHLGHVAREGAAHVAKAAMAGSGAELTAHELEKSTKGHK